MTLLPPVLLAAVWHRLRRRLPTQAALAWLLLALVVAPTLGRLHQVEHAGVLAQLRAGHAPAAHSLQGAQHGTAQHGQNALHGPQEGAFTATGPGNGASAESDHHHGLHGHGDQGLFSLLLAPHAPVDCLVLDQLALGDALHSGPQALPAQLPGQMPPVQHAGRFSAPHLALFQARGPPTA